MDRSRDARANGPAARRRRAARPVVVAALVVAAILVGRGFGVLLSDPGRPAPQDVPAEASVAVAAPAAAGLAVAAARAAASDAPRATVESGDRRDVGSAPDPRPVPGPEPEARPTGSADGAAPPRPAPLEADRFASLLAMVEARTVEGRFGRALAAAEHLRTQALDADQAAVVAVAAGAVERRLAEAARGAVDALRGGAVLEARRRLDALLADESARVLERIGPTLAAAGLQADPRAMPARGERPWPLPARMPRQRLVRVDRGTEAVVGRVVDARSDQVTLRVETPRGVTFPTVAAAACEPVDATGPEAVEMGLAALHAGEPLLARLWLAAARLRGAAADLPRLVVLGELLR